MLNAIWDDRPAAYDDKRACWLNERRVAFIDEFLARRDGVEHVVELGAGTGWLLLRLAAAHPSWSFTGVEPLRGYVEYAAGLAGDAGVADRVTFKVGRAEALGEVVAEPAQVLLTNDVLHHVEDIEMAARSAAGIAAPGARWLVIEPNAGNPYVWLMHKLRRGEATFPAGAFVRAAERAGWRLVRRTPLFLVPPQVREAPEWAKALERRLEHHRPLAGGIAIELELAPA